MNKKPLTTGEIAKYCHVVHRSVLKWIEEGKLTAYTTPGGHHRVQPEDFLYFLRRFSMPIPDVFKGIARKKRILIVDDDTAIRDSIKRILAMEEDKNMTYEIETAIDGFDAGKKLLEFMPDLVLLDIRMPGIDGYEVARRIKQSTQGKKTKIIAMSTYFKEEGKEKMRACGAELCIDKPFNTQELIAAIRTVL